MDRQPHNEGWGGEIVTLWVLLSGRLIELG